MADQGSTPGQLLRRALFSALALQNKALRTVADYAVMRHLAETTIDAGYRISSDRIDCDVPPETLEKLFRHVQAVWSKLGEIEPHFSVLSHPQYMPAAFARHQDAFYASGADEFGAALRRLETLGLIPRRDGRAVEFGCGAGRVTRQLANAFAQVVGYDVSPNLLRLAEERFENQGVRNVDLRRIESVETLAVPPHDFFYSKIVFQHNPPPIAKYFLDLMLGKLNVGGIAFFQLVTAMSDYRFDCDEYLSKMPNIGGKEIHALPQRQAFDIFERCGIVPREVVRDISAPGSNVISTLFVGQRVR